ncbi:MAG: hypothetical protein V4706_14755 [Pseudomonadota bacterium]
MTAADRKKLADLKREINQHKSRLLDIARRVEGVSPRQGEQLLRILARLEDWQNRR